MFQKSIEYIKNTSLVNTVLSFNIKQWHDLSHRYVKILNRNWFFLCIILHEIKQLQFDTLVEYSHVLKSGIVWFQKDKIEVYKRFKSHKTPLSKTISLLASFLPHFITNSMPISIVMDIFSWILLFYDSIIPRCKFFLQKLRGLSLFCCKLYWQNFNLNSFECSFKLIFTSIIILRLALTRKNYAMQIQLIFH